MVGVPLAAPVSLAPKRSPTALQMMQMMASQAARLAGRRPQGDRRRAGVPEQPKPSARGAPTDGHTAVFPLHPVWRIGPSLPGVGN